MLTRPQAETLRDDLLKRLTFRAQRVATLEAYRNGDHPLPEGLTRARGVKALEMKRVFKRLLRESRSNWCGMVVDAVDERLAVDGFRFGDDQEAAEDVWELWQANHLDADSLLVHGGALSTGQAYMTVWPGPKTGDYPVITVEHPASMIVAYVAGTRTRRAAVKAWTDEDGYRNVTLYEPDFLWKWRSEQPISPGAAQWFAGTSTSGFATQFWAGESATWAVRQPPGEKWPLPNPLQVVPVVEFRANPRLYPAPYGGGVAEFEQVIDIQDRINETVFGRLLATHFSAFKQKWATGIEIPTDDNGNEIEPFDAAVSKLWVTKNPDVKFGEFSEHDLANYINAAEADIQHLAAITKTPPHYLLGKMVNLSGDALKAAETGLISKLSRHKRFFGESHEEVARLAVKAWKPDDPRAEDVTAEVIWRDTESRSFAETVDGLLKLASIGVPREALWERIPGVTQTEIDRWRDLAPPAAPDAPADDPTDPTEDVGAADGMAGMTSGAMHT